MPTLKDIAEYAGVSHGTVSNVLNRRGNVSAKKIAIVENAAKQLGYSINAQAKQLRQGGLKRVCVIIPNNEVRSYRSFFSSLNVSLRASDYEVEIFFSNGDEIEEQKLLEQSVSKHPSAIVLVTSFVDKVKMPSSNIPVLFVERKPLTKPENAVYFGFDYYLAGQEIARRCVEQQYKNIALFTSFHKYSHMIDFRSGISEATKGSEFSVTSFQSYSILNLHGALKIQSSAEYFDVIITDTMERAEAIKTAMKMEVTEVAIPIISLDDNRLEVDNSILRYELNYGLLGKEVAKYIVSEEATAVSEAEVYELENDGFAKQELVLTEAKLATAKDRQINFLVLESPTSRALRFLLPMFTAQTGIKVNLISLSYEELYKTIVTLAEDDSVPYDLIRMDLLWLPRFGRKLFREIDFSAMPFERIRENLADIFSSEYFSVDEKMLALPFDASVQMLYYRQDLFNDSLIAREFYEQYRKPLKPPTSFLEYDEISAFFTKKLNPHSPTKYGISLTYGDSIVAACDILPRLREAQVKLSDASGGNQVNSKAIREILEKYKETESYSEKNKLLWWNKTLDQFTEGKTAMAIVFSNHSSEMMVNKGLNIAGKVGHATVPGGYPLAGGGVIGITCATEKVAACEQFVNWVYDEKTASVVTLLGGYIHHKNLVKNQELAHIYPWLSDMTESFLKAGKRTDLGLIDGIAEVDFESILGGAVRSVVLGVQTIDEVMPIIEKKMLNLMKATESSVICE